MTTDVFARGVDIERVNIVINYDMPIDSDTYLHRVKLLFYILLIYAQVGRTGRFGTKGLTITFVTEDQDKEILKQI